MESIISQHRIWYQTDDTPSGTGDLLPDILSILHTNYLIRMEYLLPNRLFIPRMDYSPYKKPIPVRMTTHTDDLSSYGYPTPLTKPSYNPGSCSDNTPSFDCVERWI